MLAGLQLLRAVFSVFFFIFAADSIKPVAHLTADPREQVTMMGYGASRTGQAQLISLSTRHRQHVLGYLLSGAHRLGENNVLNLIDVVHDKPSIDRPR